MGRAGGNGSITSIIIVQPAVTAISIGVTPISAAGESTVRPRSPCAVAARCSLGVGPSIVNLVIRAAVTVMPSTVGRCPTVVAVSIGVAAAAVTTLQSAIIPSTCISGIVIGTRASTIIVLTSAIGIAAIVIQTSLFASPVLSAPYPTRWPHSCLIPLVGPLFPPLGSLPRVLVAGLADGVSVNGERVTHDTGGGGGGACGIPDERWAAASARTTTIDPVPSDAMSLTRSVVLPPPSTAVPSCDADDGTCNVGSDNDITIIGAHKSSLLRDGDSAAAGSNSRRGRRRSSGPLVRAGHSLDSLPRLPPTVGQPRATSHRGRRSAAEAIPEASAMVPRAAPAPLLSSSVFLQLEEASVTERAGVRRSA